jgi:antitoxin (DNA-binding transcriptional repressor) of toxin-antitoxin stability system
MKTVDLAEAKKPLSDYASNLDDQPIILTVDDRPIAALVSLRNVDRESLALSTSPVFLRLMQAAREEVERGDLFSLDQLKREMKADARGIKKKDLYVERRPQGDYAVRRPDSKRASTVHNTQAEAIEVARKLEPGAAIHVERIRRTLTKGKPDKWRRA